MISASAAQLAIIGGLLILSSLILHPDPLELDRVSCKIVYGVGKVAMLAGLAAVLAAAIVVLTPVFRPSDLTSENLKELNERIEQYHRWLEKSWVLLIALTGSLLAGTWSGWLQVTAAKAKAAGRIVKATSSAKILVGFLSCCTFVGTGLQGTLKNRISEAESTQTKLRTFQVEIFSHIERTIEQGVVAQTVQQAEDLNPHFQQLVQAYNIVFPYLPSRPTPFRSEPRRMMHTNSGTEQPIPDMSLAQAETIQTQFKQASGDDEQVGPLVEDVVHLAFDNGISDQVKTYLLHVGNPLLSELVSAFLDPIFAERAERFITAQTTRIIKNHLDRNNQHVRLNEAAQPLMAGVARRIATVGQAVKVESSLLGDPGWESVRTNMRRAIAIGLRGKAPAVQDEARAMMTTFDAMWGGLGVVITGRKERRDQPEKVFSKYLKSNPDFAALWGYAVIKFTPKDYGEHLAKISEQLGLPSTTLNLLKDLVRSGGEGNLIAQQKMVEVDPHHRLTVLSTDLEYNRVWYEYHGAYPLDGYILYQSEVGGSSLDEAIRYYRSDSVSLNVERYCPNSSNDP
jgi:hypothetical protein